jgi:hypothetical protein
MEHPNKREITYSLDQINATLRRMNYILEKLIAAAVLKGREEVCD